MRRMAELLEFPLLERELAFSGRKHHIFVVRTLVAGYATLSLAGVIYGIGVDFNPEALATYFKHLFFLAWGFQILLVIFPIVLTPASLAREREEGTLQFLILAGFRNVDIYSAKFFGVFLPVASLMILPLPYYAIAYGLGIVDVQAHLCRLVILVAFSAATCAIGLLISALCRKAGHAIFAMLIVMAIWTGGTLYFGLVGGFGTPLLLNGIASLVELGFRIDTRSTMVCVLLHLILVLVASAITLQLLPRSAYQIPAGTPRRRRPRRWRQSPLFMSPAARFVYLNSAGLSTTLRMWHLSAPFSLLFAILTWNYPWLAVLAVLLLYYDASVSAASALESGVLMEVLLLPMSDGKAARTFLEAYARLALVYLPAIFALPLTLVFADISRAIFSWYGLAGALVFWGLVYPALHILSGILVATNYAFQGENVYGATFAALLIVVIIPFYGLAAWGLVSVILMLVFHWAPSDSQMMIGALACLPLVSGTFTAGYYRRYRRALRDALYEERTVKLRNR
ncbi:MAG: hypothetical protein HY706_00635 [Candidatus Hydrogenedentes bacterium]|nr:hypothetical protein [Candidatus Hydrogenedentota bacterium]